MTAGTLDHMVEHSACAAGCDQPVNDQGTGGWIHTRTGLYSCGTYPGGQARPYDADTEDERERAINAAVDAEVEVVKESMYDDDQLSDAKAESYDEGRDDVLKAVANALKYARTTHTNVIEAVQAVLDGAS